MNRTPIILCSALSLIFSLVGGAGAAPDDADVQAAKAKSVKEFLSICSGDPTPCYDVMVFFVDTPGACLPTNRTLTDDGDYKPLLNWIATRPALQNTAPENAIAQAMKALYPCKSQP